MTRGLIKLIILGKMTISFNPRALFSTIIWALIDVLVLTFVLLVLTFTHNTQR